MKVSKWAKNKKKSLCCKMFEKLQNTPDSTSSVTFCLDEFLLLWRNEYCLPSAEAGGWKTEERLGGLIRSVTAVMPSGWWFEEDTWDQRTWTMSWGVTLNWDEPLFIPRALLLFLFPISLLSRLKHLHSLWSRAYLLSSSWSIPPRYSPSGGM